MGSKFPTVGLCVRTSKEGTEIAGGWDRTQNRVNSVDSSPTSRSECVCVRLVVDKRLERPTCPCWPARSSHLWSRMDQ